jgi:ribosome maturation factor RimP
MAMNVESTLLAVLEPSLTAMGYEIVQLKMGESGGHRTLQLTAERVDGKRMEIADCEAITHRASALLDVEDVIAEAYHLEVQSPGIDRVLTRLKDFSAYAGHEAKVEMLLPIEQRKRFRGVLKGAEGETITLTCDGVDYALPFNQIRTAKLVLTDALIKATMKG